jgi:hypothetical protein
MRYLLQPKKIILLKRIRCLYQTVLQPPMPKILKHIGRWVKKEPYNQLNWLHKA